MTNAHEHLFRKLKKKSQKELVALLEQLVQRQPETETLLELLVELPLGEASTQAKQRLKRTIDPTAIRNQVDVAYGWVTLYCATLAKTCSPSSFHRSCNSSGCIFDLPLLDRIASPKSTLYTLTLTDVATGWTECLPLLYRSQGTVLAALQQAHLLFPFPMLGIDTDSGGEFINEAVLAYCEQAYITFTRGRPYLKNDQCFGEQKNGAIVRQVVGYDRLVGEQAYRQLTELYRALRLYVNCFQPSMKLLSKECEGKKVCYVYDPAKTPLQRLLLSIALPTQKQQELTEVAQALDLIGLLHQLEQLQQAVFRCPIGCSSFISPPRSDPLHIFSVEQCTAGTLPEERNTPDPPVGLEILYQEQERRKRVLGWRRTHNPPLRESGGRSFPGWWPILNGAAAASSGSCSTAPLVASSPCKSARCSVGCGKSEPICCKPLRSTGKRK